MSWVLRPSLLSFQPQSSSRLEQNMVAKGDILMPGAPKGLGGCSEEQNPGLLSAAFCFSPSPLFLPLLSPPPSF